eukprot:COSAG05_NODE_3682_length_1909_cov_1.804972_2_plen_356_part_00
MALDCVATALCAPCSRCREGRFDSLATAPGPRQVVAMSSSQLDAPTPSPTSEQLRHRRPRSAGNIFIGAGGFSLSSFETDGHGRLAWSVPVSRSSRISASKASVDPDLSASGVGVGENSGRSYTPPSSRRESRKGHTPVRGGLSANIDFSSPGLFQRSRLDTGRRPSTANPPRLGTWSRAGIALQRQVLTANIAADMQQLRVKCQPDNIKTGATSTQRRNRRPRFSESVPHSVASVTPDRHRHSESAAEGRARQPQPERRLSIDSSNTQHLLLPTDRTGKGQRRRRRPTDNNRRKQRLVELGQARHYFAYECAGATTGALHSMQLVGRSCDVGAAQHVAVSGVVSSATAQTPQKT